MDHIHEVTTVSQQNGPEEQTDRSKSNEVISSWEDTSAENSTDGMAPDQTHFQSYKEYLAAILNVWPEYWSLHAYLGQGWTKWGQRREDNPTQLVIADCTDVSADTRVFCEGDSSVGPDMLKAALNTYGEDVKTRIIMVTPCARVPAEMVDALGMALDIHPAFFQFAISFFPRSSPHMFENSVNS